MGKSFSSTEHQRRTSTEVYFDRQNTQQSGVPACGVRGRKNDKQLVSGEEIEDRTIVDAEVQRTGEAAVPDDVDGTSRNT
jgi:hypothetical protein